MSTLNWNLPTNMSLPSPNQISAQSMAAPLVFESEFSIETFYNCSYLKDGDSGLVMVIWGRLPERMDAIERIVQGHPVVVDTTGLGMVVCDVLRFRGLDVVAVQAKQGGLCF